MKIKDSILVLAEYLSLKFLGSCKHFNKTYLKNKNFGSRCLEMYISSLLIDLFYLYFLKEILKAYYK